jgi:hypothetical protein
VRKSDQQQQQRQVTTAAAAAAAFGSVPTLSVGDDLDDAAGWLLGEGLQLDTPGPVNLMTQQQQQQVVGSGVAAGSSASQQQLLHTQQLELQLQQTQQHAGRGLQQQQQQHQTAGGCWGAAAAEVYPAGIAGAAAFPASGSYSGMPQLQQELPYLGQQLQPTAVAGGMYTAAAGGVPTGQRQAGDAVQQPAAQLQPVVAGATAAAAAGSSSKVLGSDKDDLALLQVLLGWGGDA